MSKKSVLKNAIVEAEKSIDELEKSATVLNLPLVCIYKW